MIYILHIDTSGDKAVVALSCNGNLLGSKTNVDTRNHAASLNLLIDDLLTDAGISLQDLYAFAVMGGPGSYTGLRIGLSTAKGYCYALDKPLILTGKLELLTLQQIEKDEPRSDFYITILPARQQEYFCTVYNNEKNQVLAPSHKHEAEMTDIFQQFNGRICISGLLSKSIEELMYKLNVKISDIQTVDLHFWCQHSFNSYNSNDFVILATAEPFYLKQVYTHN